MQTMMPIEDEAAVAMNALHVAIASKMGGECDIVMIVHKHHEKGEPCDGVTIMSELPELRETAGLIHQAMATIHGNLLQDMFVSEQVKH